LSPSTCTQLPTPHSPYNVSPLPCFPLIIRSLPISTLFPYTTLFRSPHPGDDHHHHEHDGRSPGVVESGCGEDDEGELDVAEAHRACSQNAAEKVDRGEGQCGDGADDQGR